MPRVFGRVVLAAASCLAAAAPAAAQIVVEHDVTVGSMVSDRFTWRDAGGQPRVAVLAHNTGQTGPGGSRGGELRELRYQTPGGTRVVRASGSFASGFGYVVSHPLSEANCTGGGDTSSLGHFLPGQLTRVFEGRHQAILRFTQAYPRYCTTGAPAAQHNLPVTIEWVFSSGRDHPLWAVTWDLSAVPADTLEDDSRAPYGELLFDGSASEGAHSVIAGVSWGDRFKYLPTGNPVTYNSGWTWTTPNTVPYVKLWTTNVDATMGTVQTQTITQQDAGGYWGVNRWNTTSAQGLGCTDNVNHVMLCDYNWPYQSINYSLNPFDPDTPTNNTRLAWGTNFGFLGQAQYYVQGSEWYGGPLPNTSAPGWPRKSYSTYVVLGLHSADPVGGQVTQVETVQRTTASALVGTVAASGPAGVNRGDTVTYAPAGWNHVYGAWALRAASGQLDANFAVSAGTLTRPLVVVSNWTGAAPGTVSLNGATLAADTDYFASVRPGAAELWITLNRNFAGPTNRLQIQPALLAPEALTVDPAPGNGVLQPNETVIVQPRWRNNGAPPLALSGVASAFTGPAGPAYTIADGLAAYGTLGGGTAGSCGADCYSLGITSGARPTQHWDATFDETLSPTGTVKTWTLHVGGSFSDVPAGSPFYRFVETLLHRGITGGCGAGAYCPGDATLRQQMAVFVLLSKEPPGYQPGACVAGAEMFGDVPADSPFCGWIEELARRGVASGCGGGDYCPDAAVSREQLAVFVLRTLDLALNPVACTAGAETFNDVPADSPFCRWIEELARRGVVSGCGGGSYCPQADVTREQMSVFLAATFGLVLYGP